ncbi:E3 ubiquitin-protein ligase RNF14-like [Hylaeus volcanicus]|uniref:E3 ubiquitin-protein ligase RNF14-like n=1 Tax=Hylaeus volcanicus TaxID=313075 RepID=UPI0023B87468|nr:E3 ubiquitin-protein ligase RNF14-like [Hylaeus volcanicus]XP_053989729.1 E3 ubiquitin-protein ligase RNF14-like [Hylaeus volcanicus]XP_053989730.1 E3 ubiquitin-protein ligase RNF14-like [Hylaeus volcanicus]XP_053989731.1 E3 ubiquitin-protein ligase RNF14-like [Hylaeus volcanicus]
MDSEKQKDEIIALESIYNAEEFLYREENGVYQCSFKIFLNLPMNYFITYKDSRQLEEEWQKIAVSHLPPLTLNIILPKDYPSTSPPKFTLYSSWLRIPLLADLCIKLDELWEENKGQEILFTWVSFIQDQALEFLDIHKSANMNCVYTRYKEALEKAQNNQKSKVIDDIDKEHTVNDVKTKTKTQHNVKHLGKKNHLHKCYDKRAVLDCPVGRNPIQALIDYDEKCNQIEFKKNFYTCKVCFVDKIGEHCTQFLPCSHVFCNDCISGYLEVRIKDGNVQNICCPQEKCASEATPAQIKDLVSSELFEKYDSILLNATLDTMPDIVYCPRRNCQYPVSREPDEQLANCPVCQYAFCIHCKMGYHGIEPCKIYSAETRQLVVEYQEASNERKLQMEQRYGKKQLQSLVDNTMSENWIKSNSQKCPKCNASIEKSYGCNKMICSHCKTFFCWLCNKILNPHSPYDHFRDISSKCYNMLNQGMLEDDEEPDDFFEFRFDNMNYELENDDLLQELVI